MIYASSPESNSGEYVALQSRMLVMVISYSRMMSKLYASTL